VKGGVLKRHKVWVFFFGSYINLNVLTEVDLIPEMIESFAGSSQSEQHTRTETGGLARVRVFDEHSRSVQVGVS
jgi:hypothetical protein